MEDTPIRIPVLLYSRIVKKKTFPRDAESGGETSVCVCAENPPNSCRGREVEKAREKERKEMDAANMGIVV